MSGATVKELDQVTFSVMLRRLQSISLEMTQALERSAWSSIIALCHDFSCVIYDAKGRQLSVHDPIPALVTSLELVIDAIEDAFGDDVHDGDAFLANDPYKGNTHVGDLVIARPVFVEGRLLFWLMIKAHHMDIGAFEPASCTAAARDVYQEGLQIPPLRLMSDERIHQDLLDLILANVRLGHLVEGDLLAQLGSAERGRRLILEFCEEFGLETVEAYAEEVIAYSDRRMGAVIDAIPDGEYSGMGWVDSDGYDAKDVPIEVTVTVEGERVVVDFAGTGVQAEGGLNGSVATTLTAGRVPFLFFADADIPHNQGCLDHIEVRAPKGTIANPEFPASTSCATIVPSGMLQDVINKALAEAIPDLVLAGTARCSNVPQFFGIDTSTGEEWAMMIFNNCGGSGACKEADGWALQESTAAMGGQKALPIEQMELLHPVRVEEMEIETDSMGFGTTIGGFGVRFTLRPLHGSMDCITFGDGTANPPHGILGGTAAIGGGQYVEDAKTGNRVYASASGRVRIDPGNTWTGVATGGGGYGSPLGRDADRVRQEVRDGVISRRAAFEHFGVVLGEGADPPLDEAATAARRAELAAREEPLVTPTVPDAATWVADNLREGDVYLENPTVD